MTQDEASGMAKAIRKKQLLSGVYSKLLQGGRHHGGIQTSYRIIASSWLLATFAAIGFFLSKDNILPFSHLLGVALICLIGIIGLYLLWYEDTFVQELLLDMNVVEALRLEKEYSWLPQVHHCFLHLYKTTNARIVKVLFFIGCKSILVVIMGISLAIYFYNWNMVLTFVSISGCLILGYVSSIFMIQKAGKIQEFMGFLTDVDKRRRK